LSGPASAEELANHDNFGRLLSAKIKARERDEMAKPLQAYRDAELQKMFRQFYDLDSAYHELQRRFVVKAPPSEIGRGLAKHRRFDFTNFEKLPQKFGRSTAAERLSPMESLICPR
jgi:hypothetical protein